MSWQLFKERYGETRAEHEAAQPLYCRLCGGTVTVKRQRATYLDPPEMTIICYRCGELDSHLVSEHRQERCEVCEEVWTDHGRPCDACEGSE